jgi:ABC-type nitrate/sulfonate/bicarbonate transport system, permease component
MLRSIISVSSKKRKLKLWAVLFWMIVWQIASHMIGEEILLVSPVSTLERLFLLVRKWDFWTSIAFTLGRIGIGFLMGFLAAILLVLLAWKCRMIQTLLYPLLQIIKSIPVASFIILCLVWISSKNLSVFISFLMVFPIIYTNTLEGIQNVDKELLEMAQVFQISAGKKIQYIYISQMIPYIKSACSIALGFCWKSGIAAEIIGVPKGSIGERLYMAKIYLNMRDLFAWTVVIVILCILFEKIIMGILNWVVSVIEHS